MGAGDKEKERLEKERQAKIKQETREKLKKEREARKAQKENKQSGKEEEPKKDNTVVKEYLDNLYKNSLIKPLNAVTRNIIFVGRARSGKTTAYDVIKDPLCIPKYLSIFAETPNATIKGFVVERTFANRSEFENHIGELRNTPQYAALQSIPDEEDKTVKLRYNVNIIDTPGLFEIKAGGTEKKDDETLKKMILKCVEHEIAAIHCIFFVCSFEDGIKNEDIKAFEQFMEIFKGAHSNVAMLITRAELFNNEDKRAVIKELKQEPRMIPLLNMIDNRIFFMGALSRSDIENNSYEPVAFKAKNIVKMRQTLLESIFSCSEPVPMAKVEFISTYETVLMEKMDEFRRKMEDLKTDLLDEKEKVLEPIWNYILDNKQFIVTSDSRDMFDEILQLRLKFIEEQIVACKDENKKKLLIERLAPFSDKIPTGSKLETIYNEHFKVESEIENVETESKTESKTEIATN